MRRTKGDKVVQDHTKTVKDTVRDNIRAYRQLRGLDQADLAQRMHSLGIEWRQATVSDIERGNRNVALAEALGLAMALGVTVEQLVDSRGPEGEAFLRGPSLVITDGVKLPSGSVTALICRHKALAENTWNGNEWQSVNIELVEADAR